MSSLNRKCIPLDNCTGVPGLYTCDLMGNIVCVDSICDPSTNCEECNISLPGNGNMHIKTSNNNMMS